jgi:hypothetical protein
MHPDVECKVFIFSVLIFIVVVDKIWILTCAYYDQLEYESTQKQGKSYDQNYGDHC